MIAIALPMTLLLACGGGGGGSSGPTVEALPSPLVTDITTAQQQFAGTAPPSMTQTAIVTAIQTRATAANSWLFTGARPIGVEGTMSTVTAPTCANGSCSLNLPNVDGVDELAFSLNDIEDLSLVDDTNLGRFNSSSQSVMVVNDNTIIQSRTAATRDGARLAFQTYGGWLGNGVFGTERITITEGGATDTRLAAFSFGNTTETNLTGTGGANWIGSFVGHNVENDYLVQGRVDIDIDDLSAPDVDISILGQAVLERTDSSLISERWNNMMLTDGAFTDSDGEVRGVFYGSGYSQVGGVIDNGELVAAFGGTRQTGQ